MATHPSNLAWKIPWAEEPGEYNSPGSGKESDMTEQLSSWCFFIFFGFEPQIWFVLTNSGIKRQFFGCLF